MDTNLTVMDHVLVRIVVIMINILLNSGEELIVMIVLADVLLVVIKDYLKELIALLVKITTP